MGKLGRTDFHIIGRICALMIVYLSNLFREGNKRRLESEPSKGDQVDPLLYAEYNLHYQSGRDPDEILMVYRS